MISVCSDKSDEIQPLHCVANLWLSDLFVFLPDLAGHDNKKTAVGMIWHKYKYFSWVIDLFPGHIHSNIKRGNPLDSKSHWLNTFQKYFPSISMADLVKAYKMCFIKFHNDIWSNVYFRILYTYICARFTLSGLSHRECAAIFFFF